MTTIKTREYTGYSDSGLQDAINNALQKADEYHRVEIIETRSSHIGEIKRNFQVTLTTLND